MESSNGFGVNNMGWLWRVIGLLIGFILAGQPTLYPNFPKFIGPSTFAGMPWHSTTLAEIDSVPGSEIAMHLADGNVYVWDYNGNILNL